MSKIVNTPEGTRDRLFAECRQRRQVQETLGNLWRRRGYAQISTPEVEFYDLFLQSGNPMPQEQMLKLIDRGGKIMVMRPDCTTPIARVAATKLQSLSFPHRLYYDQTVFRSGLENRGGRSEIPQCGIELIGAGGTRGDLEMLALAVDSLRATGLEDFHIEVGHAGFFCSLADELGLAVEDREVMRTLIEGKNFAALGDFLAPHKHSPPGEALLRLAYLFGGVEVLDEAQRLAGGNEALDYLRELYEELKLAGYARHLNFDLGLVHQIDYYTGVVFRGYAQGAGDAVLSGGRYDHLVEAFGRPAQATGFAIDVDAVCGCLPQEENPVPQCLIHYGQGDFVHALTLLDKQQGGRWELSPCTTEADTAILAKERGARQMMVLNGGIERLVAL